MQDVRTDAVPGQRASVQASTRSVAALVIFAVWGALASRSPSAHAQSWTPSPGHTQVQLWPGTVPDALPGAAATAETMEVVTEELIAGKPYVEILNVSRPTLTVYSPARSGHTTGAAVVVFPGGGYKALAIDLEGTEVCDWLTAKGITCVLLKYRVPNSGNHWDAKCKCHINPPAPTALQDAQRALGLVRLHAAEWHIDRVRIFSSRANLIDSGGLAARGLSGSIGSG